jgi:hypothetical protein
MEREPFVNETRLPRRALSCRTCTGLCAFWQPPASTAHRPRHMFLPRVSMALFAATLTWSLSAQSATPPGPAPADPPITVSPALRPALSQVGQSLTGINIRRWKAPNEVKSAADQDVSSIQRDLNGTLAGLLQQADAAPGSVPAAFAVYRNIDALYDTLLRVVLTANLAATDEEVNSLQAALSSLESARGSLGDSILNATQSQQNQLIQIRAALAKATVIQRAPVTTTVVDDGPADTKPKKKTTTTRKPASSTQKPSGSNSSPQ